MHIAEFFAEQCDEHPQLLEGAVKVNWGAPTTPELLAEQLQVREEIDSMTAVETPAPPHADEREETPPEERQVSEDQAKIIEGPEEGTEPQPMVERDTPPAKSWGVYVYNAQAVAPEPACHIYGYDGAGNPLTEADATELAALLSVGHSGTIMALPNEEAPAIAPSADPLEQPHNSQG